MPGTCARYSRSGRGPDGVRPEGYAPSRGRAPPANSSRRLRHDGVCLTRRPRPHDPAAPLCRRGPTARQVRLVAPSRDQPLGGAALRVWARVTNPNPFGLTLSTLRADVSLEGARAATGDFPLGLPSAGGRGGGGAAGFVGELRRLAPARRCDPRRGVGTARGLLGEWHHRRGRGPSGPAHVWTDAPLRRGGECARPDSLTPAPAPYAVASITSRPPMNGRSAAGITTEPSFCW